MEVILSAPHWSLNGVNTFSANLARALRLQGCAARLLLTAPFLPDRKPMPVPDDLPVDRLPLQRHWRARWQALIDYLETRGPCIYLPNHDFWHSCVTPRLSPRVGIVGILHSDDRQYYDHARRLGATWDAAVAVSQAIAGQVRLALPELTPRLTVIPYGIEVPPFQARAGAPETQPERPLRVIYAGRLINRQKRVLDLPLIVERVLRSGVPMQLTIAGAGPDAGSLRRACRELEHVQHVRFAGNVPPDQMPALFARQDVLLLPSAFEGLPLAALEAMAHGCVPVVSDLRSGIPELIDEGANGFRVAVGRLDQFAERLAILQKNPELRRRMAEQAYQTVANGPYTLERMSRAYLALFERLAQAIDDGRLQRQAGPIVPPSVLSRRDRLVEYVATRLRALRRPRETA